MVYDSTAASLLDRKKDHHTMIVAGAGLAGICMAIRMKTQLNVSDVMVYEKLDEPYGTWSNSANTYPGAACDIPLALYSLSFALPYKAGSQWASQAQIREYLDGVMDQFNVNKNVLTKRAVQSGTFDDATGLWTVKVENVETGDVDTKTCNFFVVATGALSYPNIPQFPGLDKFTGSYWHTARWRHDIDITGKNVVIIGNGCTAAQIVPEIVDKTKTLTQVCRSRQSILPRPKVPDSRIMWVLFRYVPGLLYALRCIIFLVAESFFKISDIVRGRRLREKTLKAMNAHIDRHAPAKYKSALQPDFNVGAKRRIFDSGYYEALNRQNFTLRMDDAVVSFKENSVVTKSGAEIPCDICVFATGFKVQDFFFPMEVTNGQGESLLKRLKSSNAASYKGVCVSGFKNFFTLMGSNTGTGHSSVIFTVECQVNMLLRVLSPLLVKIERANKNGVTLKPAPTVTVKSEIEAEYNRDLRKQMQKKVWEENGGVSWYCDRETGKCTALYPYSQVHYWWSTRRPNLSREFDLQNVY